MTLNVKERGDHVATFRWTEVRLMEMLAAWVPTTPEMEVKLVFGAHIWDVAQHADALGKRTAELRLPLHDSLEPAVGYAELLGDVAAINSTRERVAAFYDVVLVGLENRYGKYLSQVDQLLDGPTARIVDRILIDMARMTNECNEMRGDVAAACGADEAWLNDLRRRDRDLEDIVVYRQPADAAVGAE